VQQLQLLTVCLIITINADVVITTLLSCLCVVEWLQVAQAPRAAAPRVQAMAELDQGWLPSKAESDDIDLSLLTACLLPSEQVCSVIKVACLGSCQNTHVLHSLEFGKLKANIYLLILPLLTYSNTSLYVYHMFPMAPSALALLLRLLPQVVEPPDVWDYDLLFSQLKAELQNEGAAAEASRDGEELRQI
jgi:hypothetical protein